MYRITFVIMLQFHINVLENQFSRLHSIHCQQAHLRYRVCSLINEISHWVENFLFEMKL